MSDQQTHLANELMAESLGAIKERDALRQQLAEKNAEIEQLRKELENTMPRVMGDVADLYEEPEQ